MAKAGNNTQSSDKTVERKDIVREADAPVVLEEGRLPCPGEYWEALEDVSYNHYGNHYGKENPVITVPSGTLCLVTDISLVENDEIHSVEVFVPAPYVASDTKEKYLTWLLSDFLKRFVRSHKDGVALRQSEQAAYVNDFHNLQNRLSRELGEIQSGQEMSVPALPRPDQDGGGGVGGHVGMLSRRRQELAQGVESTMALLDKEGKRLLHNMQVCANELAAQMRASAYAPKRLMGKLDTALQKLDVYVGGHIEVVKLIDGDEAGVTAPLTVYQAARYMDEEYIAHVYQGGATYKHWQEFVEYMASDQRVLDRLMPDRNSLCFMRYRRKDVRRGKAASLREVLADINERQLNNLGFLLYRRGGSVYRIDSPLTRVEIRRLFPTLTDMEEPFLDRFDRTKKLTRDDLNYDEAYQEREKLVETYERLVLTLGGIQDREGLFQGLPDGISMVQAHGDASCFRWVHDDESLLEDGKRKKIFRWIAENQSGYLQSGIRVLCNWPALVTEKTAPAAHRMRDYDRARKDQYTVEVARREGNEYVVDMPVVQHVYSRQRREYSDRETNVRVSLTRWDSHHMRNPNAGLGYVVLDAVSLEEVEHYLYSRVEREYYVDFIETFHALHDVLKEDRAQQEGFREEAMKRYQGAAGPFDERFQEAVRQWRTARRGRMLPKPGDDGFDKEVRSVVQTMARLDELAAEGGKPAIIAGTNAFALATAGRNRLVTYEPAEGSGRGIAPDYLALRRQWLRRAQGELRLERERLARYVEPLPAQEALIWSADGAGPVCRSRDGDDIESLTPEQWACLCENLEDKTLQALALQQTGFDEIADRVGVLLRMYDQYMPLVRPNAMLPLASCWVSGDVNETRGLPGYLLVWCASVTYLHLLLHACDVHDDGLARLVRRFAGYKRTLLEHVIKYKSDHLKCSLIEAHGTGLVGGRRLGKGQPVRGNGLVYIRAPDNAHYKWGRIREKDVKMAASGRLDEFISQRLAHRYSPVRARDQAYDRDYGFSALRDIVFAAAE